MRRKSATDRPAYSSPGKSAELPSAKRAGKTPLKCYSKHQLQIHLNLASRMKLTGLNQLWVADITYIRLKTEFVYLAVILDGFSRKVVGWALERTLATPLTVAALHRQSLPGSRRQAWSIIPIAACSTPQTNTCRHCKNIRSFPA